METTIERPVERDLEIVELEVIFNMDEPDCTACKTNKAEWRGTCPGCEHAFMWCSPCYEEAQDDHFLGREEWYCVRCHTTVDLKTFHKI